MVERKLNIDKSNWRPVKLGDIAFEVSERIENPSASPYERFVGLEHFVSGDLKIKQWASTENLVSATKAFKAGDILFARRNAYLRRASMVDFDGVCSGDAFVLREYHDRIVPGFLAFIVNSEKLWDFANANAAGTMSKRVKWRDLKEYEFRLPPKDQQAQIAELLWAADEVVERIEFLLSKTRQQKQVVYKDYFENRLAQNKIKMVALKDIAKIYSGGTPSRKVKKYWGGNIPWVKTAEINYEPISKTEEYITDEGLKNSSARIVPINTILMAMFGQGITRGKIAKTMIRTAINQACAAIEIVNGYHVDYIYSFLEYSYDFIRSLAHGANQQNLNLRIIKEIAIPDYPKGTQIEIVNRVFGLNRSLKNQYQYKANLKKMLKFLINKVF